MHLCNVLCTLAGAPHILKMRHPLYCDIVTIVPNIISQQTRRVSKFHLNACNEQSSLWYFTLFMIICMFALHIRLQYFIRTVLVRVSLPMQLVVATAYFTHVRVHIFRWNNTRRKLLSLTIIKMGLLPLTYYYNLCIPTIMLHKLGVTRDSYSR